MHFTPARSKLGPRSLAAGLQMQNSLWPRSKVSICSPVAGLCMRISDRIGPKCKVQRFPSQLDHLKKNFNSPGQWSSKGCAVSGTGDQTVLRHVLAFPSHCGNWGRGKMCWVLEGESRKNAGGVSKAGESWVEGCPGDWQVGGGDGSRNILHPKPLSLVVQSSLWWY